MKGWVALLVFVSAFSTRANPQSSASKQTLQTQAWSEILKSGTWTSANLTEKESLLKKLDESISKSGTNQNVEALRNSSRRAHRALEIQRHFEKCELQSEMVKSLSKSLVAGAHESLDCSPNDSMFDQAQSVAKSAQKASLIQVAQSQALANLSLISKDADHFVPEKIAEELNSKLKALANSRAEMVRELNRSIEPARSREEAEKFVEQSFSGKSVPYRSDYANLLRAPWRSVLLTQSLSEKVGSEIARADVILSSQRAGRGELRFQASLPDHAMQIGVKDVQAALAEQRQKRKEAFKSLQGGSLNLEILLTRFPVSLGQALVLSEASGETLKELCAKLQELEANEKWKKGAWQALDLGLTATTLLGGIGGIGLKVAGKAALSRALAMGAASAAAGQSTSEMMHALEASQNSDLALQFASANPSLARDPDELKKLNDALNEFSRAKSDVILNGGMSAAGVGAYLAATRHLSSGTKTADEVLEAAKNLRKPAAEDKSFARSFSKLMSCK